MSLIVFDGFLPCDHLGKPVADLQSVANQKFVYLTPGIALYCSKGQELLPEYRNDFIVSSDVKSVSFTTEDGADIGDCVIMGRLVKREALPKNILTRDSISGKSYVKEYPTVEIYDVEFKVVEDTMDGPAVTMLKEGWFPFGVRRQQGGKWELSLASDEQVNLFTALRELRKASSSKNIEMSHDDVVSRHKDPVLRNLARWDNEGKLQTHITANYKSSFKNIDLVNRYYVDMVMQEERLRVNQILAEQYDILPTGTILMYNGKNWQNDVTIPGWYMCDGQNGTPDLRERFIAGCSYSADRTIPNAPGNFGGDNSFRLKTDHLPAHAHSIPAHGHTGTIADGGSVTDHLCSVTSHEGHKHTIDGKELTLKHKLYNIGGSGARTRVLDYTDDKYYWEWGVTIPSHSHNCQNAGSHTHTVKVSLPSHNHGITIPPGGSGNTGSIGGNAAVDMSKNIKGYAVIFIMKNY
ncbi:MAG: hypothetical protein SOZ27_05065 [Spirochaetia bacterium]|nr:hypothetical protein [Spirochaetia bacterium]